MPVGKVVIERVVYSDSARLYRAAAVVNRLAVPPGRVGRSLACKEWKTPYHGHWPMEVEFDA